MRPGKITKADFEQLVTEAWDALPPQFHARLENVDVVIEEWPDPATLQRAGARNPTQLLGFYRGVPVTKRGTRYNLRLPDKISLYRQPILLRAQDRDDLTTIITRVLRHEIAHYFGIDDARLQELGAY